MGRNLQHVPLYSHFSKPFEEFPDIPPMISALDGSALYEDGWSSLVRYLIAVNDVANLHRYVKAHGTRFFGPTVVVHEFDPDRWDPFEIAAKKGSIDALRALQEIYQSDTSQTESIEARLRRKKIELLNIACFYARFDMADFLLSCGPPLGAQLNDHDSTGSPLLSAIEALGTGGNRRGSEVDNTEIEVFVYRLLDRGASVPQANSYCSNNDRPDHPDLQATVLGSAAPFGSYELASRLITDGADIHAQQIWHELWGGDVHSVTALHIASGFWNLEFLKALIKYYSDGQLAEAVTIADSKGQLPLHWALLGLDSSGRRPGQQTISEGLEIVRLLLEANPDTINTEGKSGAAFNFAMSGRIAGAEKLALVQLLLDTNPRPTTLNARDQSGATALLRLMAFYEGSGSSQHTYFVPLVNLLLSRGAERSLYDDKNQTVLHKLGSSAAYNEDIPSHLLEMLIPFVDINQADINGWTALHFMARNLRQVNASRLLVNRGADASAVNNKGNTPLHEVMTGRLVRKEREDGSLEWPTLSEKIQAHDEIISILQDAGASMDQPNVTGRTPAQLLVEKRAKWDKGGE
ncbi:uncharacterized protein N7511_005187 [Penicillium nucicola]|uniref:uncharacterized protein n=1 Tax=Penicillium nucicola TaxID=1850975 RepID=UPI002545A157|nr:uncharacterized protein N7511_005187 [Penicillium nucicola]KAJ5761805.1 hypothetical protein N7511_005187 [Penicillium nucicola]